MPPRSGAHLGGGQVWAVPLPLASPLPLARPRVCAQSAERTESAQAVLTGSACGSGRWAMQAGHRAHREAVAEHIALLTGPDTAPTAASNVLAGESLARSLPSERPLARELNRCSAAPALKPGIYPRGSRQHAATAFHPLVSASSQPASGFALRATRGLGLEGACDQCADNDERGERGKHEERGGERG
jgi:hypothetical protein